MNDSKETSKTSKNSEDATRSNASITIHGLDGATLNLILAKVGASVAMIAACSTAVLLTAAFVIMVVWRESDRANTQAELTRLQMGEISLILAREGLKKPGDDWYGAILNEAKQNKQQKEDK